MREISLREANQTFATCIARVEAGEHIILTRRGEPVAEIRPYTGAQPDLKKEEARKRLIAVMDAGWDLGGNPLTDDERHGR